MKNLATIDEIDRMIRRDPARRGLIATEEARGPLCPGQLALAAVDLADCGQFVVIVTGFFIPAATPPAAETDGPPGAVMLAAALIQCGMTVKIVTDAFCRRAVEVAAQEMHLPESTVVIPGNDLEEIERWFRTTAAEQGARWTHLIAIERVGPSHTPQSITQQLSPNQSTDLAEFQELVPPHEQNHNYNMRGVCIDAVTPPLHRLFELAHQVPGIKTIGIGDGGNEIGMGSISWQELRLRLNNESAARTPCRIATDWTIVAGVSNWGGMALAASILWLKDQATVTDAWTTRQQLQLLERMVAEGPAVDGITRLPEPTVDGLPFLTYIQAWEGIQRAVHSDRDSLSLGHGATC